MVSAIDQVTAKLGEKKLQQAETILGSSLPEHTEIKAFMKHCLGQGRTRFLAEIIDDQALIKFAENMRLHSMSEGTIGTYISAIYKVCKDMKVSPLCFVEQAKQMTSKQLQERFNELAEHYLFKTQNPIRGSTMRIRHFALTKLLEVNGLNIDDIRQVKPKFRTNKRRPIPFTKEEVKAIIKEASPSPRNSLWIWLLCQSFAREGVLYTLTFADFTSFLEAGKPGLIWIDGEQRHTKERMSHDLPVSPEVIAALRRRKVEIEEQGHTITRENAQQFPIVSHEKEPTRKLSYFDFLGQVRRIVQRAGVQGQAYSTGTGRRYTKDVHTGFRGFCLTQWKGITWLAKYFAGQKIPQDAYNYVHYETVDAKEKIADYLKYRPRPFDDADVVEEACAQLANLGFDVDSKVRELLQQRAPGGERESYKEDCRYCYRDAGEAKGRD